MTFQERSAEPLSNVEAHDLRYDIVAPEDETGVRIGLGEDEIPDLYRQVRADLRGREVLHVFGSCPVETSKCK